MKLKELEKEVVQFNKQYKGVHRKCIYIYWEANLHNGGICLKTFKKQVKAFGKEYLDYVFNAELVDGFKMTRYTKVLVPVKRIYINNEPDEPEAQLSSYIIVVKDIY